MKEYGREDETTAKVRNQWNFENSEVGARARSGCADQFWPALHMDLRMVDTSDFVIAYVPDQCLQRRNTARDHPLSAAAQARAVH